MSDLYQRLSDAIASRSATVGVIGLGYVGLPLALAFARAGFRVLGFDLDAGKVATLNRGETYLLDFPDEQVAEQVRSQRLSATTDSDRLTEVDAVIICVPTPLTDKGQPDLGFVEETARSIQTKLAPGQLVVLESTTYPGTTEEVVRPLLEAGGLRAGRDFFLAYSPEREDPGSASFRLESIPKVVGGVDSLSTRLAEALYAAVVSSTVAVSSTRVAEASKLTENIFRAVNIALVNELKIIFDSLGVDVWEVLDAAATKPFGFMRFDPGPGWGGHCIPIDPFYLAWKAREAGTEARFIELAGVINTQMPRYVLSKLEAALATGGGELRGSRVLLIGIAYKRNVADPRESPAFAFLDLLIRAGALPAYHDPFLPAAPRMRNWPELEVLESQPLTPETLQSHDAVVIVTDHDSIDYDLIAEHARLVIDARGRYRTRSENIVPA